MPFGLINCSLFYIISYLTRLALLCVSRGWLVRAYNLQDSAMCDAEVSAVRDVNRQHAL